MYFLYSHQQCIHGNFLLFGHAMWPGIEPTAPTMEAVFTTGPPGKSQKHFFFGVKVFFSIVNFIVSEDLLISLRNPNSIFRFFFFPLAKGNFSKFPQGQITQEGITLTILHSKRRGSWVYMWLVCKPLLNPLVFWSSTPLLCLVLWIQGLSLLPPGGGLPVLERLWERQEPGCPHWWRGSGPATWNSFQGSSANFLTILPAYTYLTFNFL